MLRIQRVAEGKRVRFVLSGRIESEYLEELQRLLDGEKQESSVVFDLGEIKLVDCDGVGFLARCEAAGATLERCPAYVREWIRRKHADHGTPRRNRRARGESKR